MADRQPECFSSPEQEVPQIDFELLPAFARDPMPRNALPLPEGCIPRPSLLDEPPPKPRPEQPPSPDRLFYYADKNLQLGLITVAAKLRAATSSDPRWVYRHANDLTDHRLYSTAVELAKAHPDDAVTVTELIKYFTSKERKFKRLQRWQVTEGIARHWKDEAGVTETAEKARQWATEIIPPRPGGGRTRAKRDARHARELKILTEAKTTWERASELYKDRDRQSSRPDTEFGGQTIGEAVGQPPADPDERRRQVASRAGQAATLLMSTSDESLYLSPQGHVYWERGGTIQQAKQERKQKSRSQGSLLANVDFNELRKGIIDTAQFPGLSERQNYESKRIDRRVLITGNRDLRYRESELSFPEDEYIQTLNALLLLRGNTLTAERLAKHLEMPVRYIWEIYNELTKCFANAKIFGTIVNGEIIDTCSSKSITSKRQVLGILPEASFIDLRDADMLRQAPRHVFKNLGLTRRKPEGRLKSRS